MKVSPDRPVFIYALCDPDTNACRYIGQSCAPHHRLKQHKDWTTARRLVTWLIALTKAGKEPVLTILEETCGANSDEREVHWILHMDNLGADLLNDFKNPQVKRQKEAIKQAAREADEIIIRKKLKRAGIDNEDLVAFFVRFAEKQRTRASWATRRTYCQGDMFWFRKWSALNESLKPPP